MLFSFFLGEIQFLFVKGALMLLSLYITAMDLIGLLAVMGPIRLLLLYVAICLSQCSFHGIGVRLERLNQVFNSAF